MVTPFICSVTARVVHDQGVWIERLLSGSIIVVNQASCLCLYACDDVSPEYNIV